jgi:hypothetical protein
MKEIGRSCIFKVEQLEYKIGAGPADVPEASSHREQVVNDNQGGATGVVREFIDFLKYNKKWWLTPIMIVTLLLVGAALLLPSPVAPFIYSLF